ncbi:MAG TPA: ankyrin repeat domain-containing protein [Bacteroidales bacterium]|jgi:ankyrin repeat protein|nr:ankyrin repeat domain-containing protein [Bacteroidales bacterium]
MKSIRLLIIFTSLTFTKSAFCQQDSLSNNDLNYKLLVAVYEAKVDSVIFWLNAGADPNAVSSDGVCALNYAIQSGQYNSVKALLLNGADVNYETSYSLPPLFMAIAYNQPAIVELLLKKGANVDKVIKNKISVLHYATKYADTSVVSLLLKYGAKPTAIDDEGNTVMMGLIFYKRYDLLPYFDWSETLIKFPDNDGLTPFLLAVQIGDTSMAGYLLRIGANINDVSNNGYGLMEYALISKSNIMLDWALKKKDFVKTSGNNLIRLSYFLGDRKQAKVFKQNGFKSYWKPVLQCLHFGYSVSFNNQDMLWGLTFGLFESHYGFNLGINFQTRLWSNRIFIDYGNDLIYQFWERRTLWGIYLQKRALLYTSPKRNLYLNMGGNAYLTYGKYRGVSQRPDAYGFFAPSVELMLKGKSFSWAFSGEYFKFKNIEASPIHFKLSALFNIPMGKIYMPYKKINWQ